MTAVLSLGSNLGDRLARLREGLVVLRPAAVSSVWETEPVGDVPQGPFLNLVALLDCDAATAWQRAQQAEQQAGRVREVPGGPRTLDVDLLLAPPPAPPGLVVPHPGAHVRAFVLAPWLEVEPEAVLPGHGPVRDLLAAVGSDGVRRTDLVTR